MTAGRSGRSRRPLRGRKGGKEREGGGVDGGARKGARKEAGKVGARVGVEVRKGRMGIAGVGKALADESRSGQKGETERRGSSRGSGCRAEGGSMKAWETDTQRKHAVHTQIGNQRADDEHRGTQGTNLPTTHLLMPSALCGQNSFHARCPMRPSCSSNVFLQSPTSLHLSRSPGRHRGTPATPRND